MAQSHSNSDVFYPGDPLHVKIVTPDELVLNEPVDLAEIPSLEGYMGILPGHSSTITALKPGVIYLHRREAIDWKIYISGGFAEISGNHCVILAETAADISDLDAGVAEADIKRLSEEAAKPHTEYERQKIQKRLDEAQMRLSVARREFVKVA